MKYFKIGNRVVGEEAPVLVVAELSANHGGKLDTALATIEMAAKCGADAIKIQTYTPDTLTLRSNAAPFVVQTKNEWAGRTLHDLYAEAMTPWEWHKDLRDCARAAGLLFFSTPFDPTAVELLEELDVPAHKIASFELVDLPLVERVARTGKPIIMSTGMASLGEIEAAVRVCESAGNGQIALLRCVSAYPAKPESMDLASLAALSSFDCVIGLSDHTREPTAAIAAVALGARILEKHFILRRDVGGPDAFFSLEPDELRQTVAAVRAAQAAVGRPRFGPANEEVPSLAFRRSLFVARDVPAGKVLDCDDVRSVRPSGGLAVRHMPEVLGRTAARALAAGTPLSWDGVGSRTPPAITAITLRRATADDAPVLLAWRNDPETRRMSLSSGTVTEAEHAAWLAQSLASTLRSLFVAEHGGQAIGQARLDVIQQLGALGSAEVSITVAPGARGKGHAPAILVAAEHEARRIGITRLEARIKPDNEASVRAFKRAGYYGFARAGDVLRCERRIAPYE
jgi:N-acetylneuraminate synthase